MQVKLSLFVTNHVNLTNGIEMVELISFTCSPTANERTNDEEKGHHRISIIK